MNQLKSKPRESLVFLNSGNKPILAVAAFLFLLQPASFAGKLPTEIARMQSADNVQKQVAGRVLDEQMQPLAGATISLVDAVLSTASKEDGTFELQLKGSSSQ